MSPKISYSFTANVSDGPSLTASGSMDVEAYSEIEVTVPAGGSVDVDVQPGSGGQMMVITGSDYTNLTYEVDGSGTSVTLDGPHVLIGSGAVALLGGTQNSIAFSNGGAEDATVHILVGRDATPSP